MGKHTHYDEKGRAINRQCRKLIDSTWGETNAGRADKHKRLERNDDKV